MIINYDFYYCNKCKKGYGFDTSKEYSKLCPICNTEMEFFYNGDCDTELAEKVKSQTPIVPSSKPQIICPYCQSTRVSRIGLLSRIVSVELWGLASSKIGKQWRCDNCGSEF